MLSAMIINSFIQTESPSYSLNLKQYFEGIIVAVYIRTRVILHSAVPCKAFKNEL